MDFDSSHHPFTPFQRLLIRELHQQHYATGFSICGDSALSTFIQYYEPEDGLEDDNLKILHENHRPGVITVYIHHPMQAGAYNVTQILELARKHRQHVQHCVNYRCSDIEDIISGASPPEEFTTMFLGTGIHTLHDFAFDGNEKIQLVLVDYGGLSFTSQLQFSRRVVQQFSISVSKCFFTFTEDGNFSGIRFFSKSIKERLLQERAFDFVISPSQTIGNIKECILRYLNSGLILSPSFPRAHSSCSDLYKQALNVRLPLLNAFSTEKLETMTFHGEPFRNFLHAQEMEIKHQLVRKNGRLMNGTVAGLHIRQPVDENRANRRRFIILHPNEEPPELGAPHIRNVRLHQSTVFFQRKKRTHDRREVWSDNRVPLLAPIWI